MYKTKPRFRCNMPSDAPLSVLALNASLKHEPSLSNTGELASLVLDERRALGGGVTVDMVRLADATLPVGIGFRESPEDAWPGLVTKIKAADIVLFCTPIWWGGRSSLMQRLIERLDSLDEEYSATGRSVIKGKVAGIVITGSEDGALSVMGSIMMVLSFMGFTLPPECAAYWVGEVGQPTSQDRDKRLRNMATMHMAKGLAQSVVYHARLLKAHRQTFPAAKATCCEMHADLDAPR
jgi:multimeric flavodoxin WrbA